LDRVSGEKGNRGHGRQRVLILHAKAPLAGFAKSRLVDPVAGRDAAFVARLADAFLRDTLTQCRDTGADEVVFHFAPPESADYFRSLDPAAHLQPQLDAPFGVRLATAFASVFARGDADVVLVGMDTPHLSAATMRAAFTSLDDADAVLGPAEDGGYYLIGMTRRHDSLFDCIDWSTPRVAAQTRDRARSAGLSLVELVEEFDVDDTDDLERLRTLLRAEPNRCPATAAVLLAAASSPTGPSS
jgi:uncharacterized protein